MKWTCHPNPSRCRVAGHGGLATEGADAVSALIAVRAALEFERVPKTHEAMNRSVEDERSEL
jgi:hypothetical protein